MTYKRLHILLGVFVFTVVAVSCRKEPIPGSFRPYEGSDRIHIMPTVDGDWVPVKAIDWNSIDETTLKEGGFGVYAYYTGDEEFSSTKQHASYERFGTVLNNRQFSYSTENGGYWYYAAPEEYWPAVAGEYLTFFAYAPYSVWNDKVVASGPVPYIPYTVAPDLTQASMEAQRDLLWGTNESGIAHKDVQAGDFATKGLVDMHFRHALSKLFFTISGTKPDWGEKNPQESDSSVDEDPWPADNVYTEGTSQILIVPSADYEWKNDRTQSGRNYTQTAVKHWTFTLSISTDESQTRSSRLSRTGSFLVGGNRYLIKEVSLRGLNKSGNLLLDNTTARMPEWDNPTAFTSAPDYVLDTDAGSVLTQSLRRVDDTTLQSNLDTYTGISMDPIDLMSSYPLYAIPRSQESGPVEIGVKYSTVTIEGKRSFPMTAVVTDTRTRTHTKTWYYKVSTQVSVTWRTNATRPQIENQSFPNPNPFPTESNYSTIDDWTPDPDNPDIQPSWTDASSVTYTQSSPDWVYGESTYTDFSATDKDVSLVGSIPGLFEGGKAYTVNLLLSGDRIELEVTPKPWTLSEQDYQYYDNVNTVIQALTYDGNTVDHADHLGNVYINNRMSHFYFQLGEGRYVRWQAILVGDTAFGFTDSEGNFLRDTNNSLVPSIGGVIDPDARNDIYIRAVDDGSMVTSRAKLRIYLIDAMGKSTAALNLVNMDGVTEWTIIQNAN